MQQTFFSPGNRMHHLKILIIAIAITLGSGSVVTQAENFDVYVLTGQSNSLGTTGLEGGAPNYEPGTDAADSNTRFFWSNATTALPQTFPPNLYGDSGGVISSSLQMQQGDGGSNPFFWGPEYGFARQMAENSGGNNILIIKASRGGGGNSLWDKSTFDANNSNGHMWGHVRNTVDAGLGQLTTSGDTFSVKGLIYMQGESNSSIEAGIAGTRLSTLSSNLKSHINSNWAGAAGNMYTVAAEIAASGANADRIQTTTLQRNLGRNDTGFGFVTTGDQPLKSDNIHFGRDAKLTYGSRIADAFNSLSYTENANTIAGYSANPKLGSPIPDPAGQGLSFGGNGAGVTAQAVNDGGIQAWRLFDNSAASNPGYRQELRDSDFSRMFDDGWKFTANAKVVAGGGLALWSTSQNDDPGWGLTNALNMNGFQLNRIVNVLGDELEVKLWSNQATFNLGADSADAFHKYEMIGAAGSPLYDFYIDGQLQSAGLDLRTGLGNAGFNDMLIFNSGSTGGTGLDVYWNEVSLTAVTSVPEPTVLGPAGMLFCLSALLRRKR